MGCEGSFALLYPFFSLHFLAFSIVYIVHLIASQGFGKATTAKRLCQLFDNSSVMMADIYEDGSTPSALRDTLTDTWDRLILLDDICRGTGRANQHERRDLAASWCTMQRTNPLLPQNGKSRAMNYVFVIFNPLMVRCTEAF